MGVIYKNGISYSNSNDSYTLEYESPNIYLYENTTVASTVNIEDIITTVIASGISTTSVSNLSTITFSDPTVGIVRNNSNRVDGIINSKPIIIPRGTGSPIFSIPIGGIVFIKCSSHLHNLIGTEVENILPGDTFYISNELASGGQGVYLAAMKDGVFTDASNLGTNVKRFLGAGLYMALSSAEMATRNSTVLVQKIGTAPIP